MYNNLETHGDEARYLDLMRFILAAGEQDRPDRTGTGTTSLFGGHLTFDLTGGKMPLLTTKKVHWKSVVGELLWFISGCKGGIKGLRDNYGVTIWDEWEHLESRGFKVAYENMTKWRAFQLFPPDEKEPINQLKNVIEAIKTDPQSRRHLVSMWNADEVNEKDNVLDPCHVLFQFYVRKGGYLQCQMYQRSVDMFLGAPFNIASYALLTHLVAHCTGLKAASLRIAFGDMHIYNNHIEQVKLQLTRTPKEPPTILLNSAKNDIFAFEPQDIELVNYFHHPAIKAPVSV